MNYTLYLARRGSELYGMAGECIITKALLH